MYNQYSINNILSRGKSNTNMSEGKPNSEKQIQQMLRKREIQKNLQLRRKLINRELDKIQNMPLSDIIDRKRKNSVEVDPPELSEYNVKRKMMNALDPNVYGKNGDVQNPVHQHYEMMIDTEKRLKEIRKDMRSNPLLSQIKRGKLGMDTLFIPFAIFGSLLLPLYFYKQMQQTKRKIIESRPVSPEVIAHLDQDSPISLDSVSQQSIHYSNPERDAQFKQQMKKAAKMTQLRRQLDL